MDKEAGKRGLVVTERERDKEIKQKGEEKTEKWLKIGALRNTNNVNHKKRFTPLNNAQIEQCKKIRTL